MARTFGEFVADQVARAEALPSSQNYVYSEAAQIEICNWLETRAGEKYDAVKASTLQWLQESTPARQVKAVIDEIMEGDRTPTMGDIKSAWEKLHGAKAAPVNYDCPACGGSGFEQVVSGTGAEGARRCRRGCAVPAPRFDAEKPAQGTDSAANAALGVAFASDVAAKFAKPVVVPPEPPPLVNALTEDDIRKAKKR